jgi:uncharacterized membrane protein HdeD (DUF308 family)
MTSETTRVQEAISDWAGEARKNAGWLIGFGVLTVIAGVLAIAAPLGSGLGITIFIGVALAIGGGARIIAAFGADSFGQGALAFIGGLLGAVAGVILATRPGLGLATLTLLIGSYLLVDGIASAVLAFRVRPDQGWGWILFSGIITVLLGILLLAEWPISGTWALGTLVGVNLLFSGFAMISIGSAARRLTKTAAA